MYIHIIYIYLYIYIYSYMFIYLYTYMNIYIHMHISIYNIIYIYIYVLMYIIHILIYTIVLDTTLCLSLTSTKSVKQAPSRWLHLNVSDSWGLTLLITFVAGSMTKKPSVAPSNKRRGGRAI